MKPSFKNPWDFVNKNIGNQERNIDKEYINRQLLNSVKQYLTPVKSDKLVDPLTKSDFDILKKYQEEALRLNPQNLEFRMQGGAIRAKIPMNHNIGKGSKPYVKKPVLHGGFSPSSIMKHLFITPIVRGFNNEIDRANDELEQRRMRGGAEPKLKKSNPTDAQLKKIEELRAKMASNVKPKRDYNAPDVKEKRIAAQVWRKSRAGKEKLADIAELNDEEKIYNARAVAKQYGKDVIAPKIEAMKEQRRVEQERKEASDERGWAQQDRADAFYRREDERLAREAKQGNVWDLITGEAIKGVSGLLPKPLGKVVEGVANEGVKALKGLGKKELSLKQKAHQAKIKMIMNKEKCSFKEALTKLKNYK